MDNPGENEPVLQEQKKPMAAKKSLTFEQVKQKTGLSEREIKSLLTKKILRRSRRNPNLVLTDSVLAWQKEQHS